jgi:tricorn protease interacting factor F2/3
MLEYDLFLNIDYAENRFQGVVEIHGAEDERLLELDCIGLKVGSVEVGGSPTDYELGGSPSKLRIRRGASAKGPVRVHYSGVIAQDLQTGFFVAAVGARKAFATQMQPESCRRLVPCWDRPDRKAVFRLRVTTQSGLAVISNMTSVTRARTDGRTEWSFAPTPPMSTYLFFLGVGPFEETVDEEGPIPIILAGVGGRTTAARRTLKVARMVLRGYTEYFDVPYPLPKLHIVALTNFWVGMENWGAISGADEMYLLDESASPEGLEYADQVVAHEVAHQWFGDLVTLATWDDLWLNEAFATIAVPLVQERTGLRRDPWTEFALRTDWADLIDSLRCAHAVKPDTLVPAEIMANADEITYQKGSRLLRMIQAFVGDDRFRDGITEYLRDHQLGNARSDDLWAALEEESALPVSRVMRMWVERPGHPVVTVRQKGRDVELSQRRFTLLPHGPPENPWPIPLALEHGGRRSARVFDSRKLTLKDHSTSDLRLDPDRTGFFRILWPAETRTRLIGELLDAPPSDRVGFLKDAAAFLHSGDYSLDEYCGALDAVRSAEDRLTVETVAHQLDYLYPVLGDEARFSRAAREFLRAQTERLGERTEPQEPEGRGVARQWVFRLRARVDPAFARELAPRFDTVDSEPHALRQAITTAFATRSGTGGIDRILARVKGPDPDAAVQTCFACDGVANSKVLLQKLWEAEHEFSLGNVVSYLIPSLSKNPAGRPALWGWLVDHLRDIERRTTGTYSLTACFSRGLPTLGIGRSNVLRAYFDRESFPEALPGIRRGLELLEANELLRSRSAAMADRSRHEPKAPRGSKRPRFAV